MFHGTEASTRGVLLKKLFLQIPQWSQENTCVWVFFLIKLQFLCLAKLLNLRPRKTSTDKILASFSQNILHGIRFTKAVKHKTQ